MRASLLVSTLPRTFQDAVHFTRSLGLRYLWIDALCIIQDSREDWLWESLRIAKIYSFAYLNIASTHASDGNGGLYRNKNKTLLTPISIEATWIGHPTGSYICHDPNTWERRVESGPLNTRAWVFQERILSPRTVHFAQDQLWWECRDYRACEADPDALQPTTETSLVHHLMDFDEAASDMIAANESWLSLVERYTRTYISKDSDRLIALAGIAQVVCKSTGWSEQDYLAGLWKHDFLVDLLWRVREEGSRVQNGHVAPSWSWASVNGGIYFNSSDNRDRIRQYLDIEVLNIDIDAAGSRFGSVIRGALEIRGVLQRIRLSNPQTVGQSSMSSLAIGSVRDLIGDEDFAEVLDDESLYHNAVDNDLAAFWCRFVTVPAIDISAQCMSEGLLLQMMPDSPPGHYTRLGQLRLFHQNSDAWPDAPENASLIEYFQRRDGNRNSFMLV